MLCIVRPSIIINIIMLTFLFSLIHIHWQRHADADFVMVHVINNIDPAAMKHGNNSGTSAAASLSYRSSNYQHQHSTWLFVWKCLIVLALINKSFSIR